MENRDGRRSGRGGAGKPQGQRGGRPDRRPASGEAAGNAGQRGGEARGAADSPRSGGPRRTGTFHPSSSPAKIEAAAKRRRARTLAKKEARRTGVPGEEVLRPHDPVLDVREASAVDFAQMVGVMPPEWFMPGMTEQERQAQARADMAGALAEANVALVATVDDGTGFDPQLVGVLFARVQGCGEPAAPESWRGVETAALDELAAGSPLAREAHRYVVQLSDRGALLRGAAGADMGADNELMLFMVSPQARGNGAGGALVREFERRLREAGQSHYWLQTDTSCSWQWYPAHGYRQVAAVDLGQEFAMPPVMGEGGAGEPQGQARAFMFCRDLG